MINVNELLGQAVKIQTTKELEPFYFKVTQAAKNGSSIVGVNDEGQNMLIKTADIIEVKM